MPKSPIDLAINGLTKVVELHNKIDTVRRTLDSVDPLNVATDVLGNVTKKVNDLDRIVASTRRYGRRRRKASG